MTRQVSLRTYNDVTMVADGIIAKTDAAWQNDLGWAHVAHDNPGEVNVDKSGDFMDESQEIEKSTYQYVLKSRASDVDHTNVQGGTMVESVVFTPDKIEKIGIFPGILPIGWLVGFHIDDVAT